MRKNLLMLLVLLLVFNSVLFTTPITPTVEAAGDDGKREVFSITLPSAYGQKPSGYKFQKINHSGRMDYSIYVEGVKARTQITKNGIQIFILLRDKNGLLDTLPNPFNTNLNNTLNPNPNVPQATDLLGKNKSIVTSPVIRFLNFNSS